MDSISQIVLGAAVSEAVIGRRVGNKALLWGAIAGTLPDLDVLIPFNDPVKDFTYHRSFSHSFFFLTLITPAITWLVTRIHATTSQHKNRWTWAVWLALITHPILDCFTVYGTQILWPFTDYPVTWSTVFIVDPMYTVWLTAGVLSAMILSRSKPLGHRISGYGLVASCVYLGFTLGAKFYVNDVAASAVQRQRIPYREILTTPAPFNTLLWRIVAVDRNGYHEGFFSLLDETGEVRFTSYPSRPELLDNLEASWAVQRLQWFTKGVFRVLEKEGIIIITDLRMGQEPYYIFSFAVGRRESGRITPIPTGRATAERVGTDQLLWVWNRIWSSTAY